MDAVRNLIGIGCRVGGVALIAVGALLLLSQAAVNAQPPPPGPPSACPYTLPPNPTTPCDQGCNGTRGNCATKGCNAINTGTCAYCSCKGFTPPQNDPDQRAMCACR